MTLSVAVLLNRHVRQGQMRPVADKLEGPHGRFDRDIETALAILRRQEVTRAVEAATGMLK